MRDIMASIRDIREAVIEHLQTSDVKNTFKLRLFRPRVMFISEFCRIGAEVPWSVGAMRRPLILLGRQNAVTLNKLFHDASSRFVRADQRLVGPSGLRRFALICDEDDEAVGSHDRRSTKAEQAMHQSPLRHAATQADPCEEGADSDRDSFEGEREVESIVDDSGHDESDDDCDDDGDEEEEEEEGEEEDDDDSDESYDEDSDDPKDGDYIDNEVVERSGIRANNNHRHDTGGTVAKTGRNDAESGTSQPHTPDRSVHVNLTVRQRAMLVVAATATWAAITLLQPLNVVPMPIPEQYVALVSPDAQFPPSSACQRVHFE